ncbi:MAG: hypothetical protein CMC57_00440 [Flavobacteriaceae bacterium]|nr:hypothetical protein [Flavobacteriaceae bacterium]
MKIKKLIILLMTFPIVGFSQFYKEKKSDIIEDNSLKRFSVGVKFGLPYMAVLGAQYTLPFFNNHFAPYFDYSQYSYEKNNEDAQFRFSEFGISYFFNQIGKGLYAGLSYSNLSYNVKFTNVILENGSKGYGGEKIDMRTTNLRIGLKTGGTFYFRIEMGYGLGDIPKKLSFKAIDNFDPKYSQIVTKEIPKISGTSEREMLIGNIGVGISF